MNGYLTLGSTALVDIGYRDIRGQTGLGFYRLLIQLGATPRSNAQATAGVLTSLDGDLWVMRSGNRQDLVGTFSAMDESILPGLLQYTGEYPLYIFVDLDGRRIDAIESTRFGGDLRFRLDLRGTFLPAGRTGMERVTSNLDFVVNQSSWVQALEQMGYRKTLLLEIPMPRQDAPEQLRQVIEHLQSAQDLMIHGRYREAVGACRDTLDSLDTALGDEQEIPAPVKEWLNHTREMDKAARVRLIRRALKSLTHPARHADEASALVEWGPEDARVAVAISAALLRLASEQRQP